MGIVKGDVEMIDRIPIRSALEIALEKMSKLNVGMNFVETQTPLFEIQTPEGNLQVRLSIAKKEKFINKDSVRIYTDEDGVKAVQDKFCD